MKESREYISTISSKGQVTVSAEIRRTLGLKPQDKLIFRGVEGKVEMEPFPMTLEEAYGSVKPLLKPEDSEAVRAIVREERVDRAMTEEPEPFDEDEMEAGDSEDAELEEFHDG